MKPTRHHELFIGIFAVVALVTGCGENATDQEDVEMESAIERSRYKLRPIASRKNAPTLQPQDVNGGDPANLIPFEKLTPINAANTFEGKTEDVFGEAVAIDGNTIAVGAPERDDQGNNSGAVYVFVNDNGAWSFQQKLLAKGNSTDDNFGFSLALQGNRLVVGARGPEDVENNPDYGYAHVYQRDTNKIWTRTCTILPADGVPGDYFGYSVALLDDLLLIGASRAGNPRAGAAYLYRIDGTQCTLVQKLVQEGGAADDFYGASVALLPETKLFTATALVGAWNDIEMPGDNDGAVFAYGNFNGQAGPWELQAVLRASDQTAGDVLGFSLSGVGQRAFIGAPYRSRECQYTGAVYVFNRHSGVWCEEAILVPEDKNAGQLFGYAVSASEPKVLIGSAYDDDGGDYSGSAYVYGLQTGEWVPELKFVPSDTAELKLVGFSAALDGDQAAIGAIGDIRDNIASGSTYLFSATTPAPVTLKLDSSGSPQCSHFKGSSSGQTPWGLAAALLALGVRRISRKLSPANRAA